jgi:hypothetical protein
MLFFWLGLELGFENSTIIPTSLLGFFFNAKGPITNQCSTNVVHVNGLGGVEFNHFVSVNDLRKTIVQ